MKLFWISGASSGIGRALVDTCPWEDARILNVSRTNTHDVDHVAADLATSDGWDTVQDSFRSELEGFAGEMAGFIHCAATTEPIGFAGEVDAREYRRAVLLNAVAPQVLGQAFLHAVGSRDVDAWVVLLTSGAARSVYEGWSAYGAGKAAVEAWVRAVAQETVHHAAARRIIAVSPGPTATSMQQQIRASSSDDFPRREKFVTLDEQGRLAEPAEVARRIWSLLAEPVDTGAVLDLRD